MDATGSSTLLPSDCVSALRSFPRRLTTALEPVRSLREPEDRDALARHPGPDGESPLQLLHAVSASASELQLAVAEMLRTDEPLLPAAPVPPHPSNVAGGAANEIESFLATIQSTLVEVADRLGDLPTAAWQRTGHDAKGAAITVLDMTRRQVGVIATHLRGIDQVLGAVEGSSN